MLFSSRPFFLACGPVCIFVLGSSQACAVPFVYRWLLTRQGGRAKSQPLLRRAGTMVQPNTVQLKGCSSSSSDIRERDMREKNHVVTYMQGARLVYVVGIVPKTLRKGFPNESAEKKIRGGCRGILRFRFCGGQPKRSGPVPCCLGPRPESGPLGVHRAREKRRKQISNIVINKFWSKTCCDILPLSRDAPPNLSKSYTRFRLATSIYSILRYFCI